MTNKHTPGPWHTIREGSSTVYVESRIGGGWVQEVSSCGPTANGSEEQEANARLIAAAPELLDALEMVMKKYSKHLDGFAFEQCHAAISKATGA